MHNGNAELNEAEFPYNHVGFSEAEAINLLKRWGKNEIPDKVVPKWVIFMSLLVQPMPVMIWLSCLIEIFINNYMDLGILLVIQFANASIAFYETTKAGDAVAALKNSLKPEATVKRNGKWRSIDATQLVPGDLVLLSCGAAIPADCRLNGKGPKSIEVDQAQLTGESLPVTLFGESRCMMGSTVVRGEIEATVEFTGLNTFFGKTASLLQGPAEISNLQNILLDIMIILVGLSLILCSIVFAYIVLEGESIDNGMLLIRFFSVNITIIGNIM